MNIIYANVQRWHREHDHADYNVLNKIS